MTAATDTAGPADTGRPSAAARSLRWAGQRLAHWWVLVDRPASLAETWQASAVDLSRVPAGTPWQWPALWRLSNATDRLLLFALMLLLPPIMQGPLRWVAVRPTRRVGAYLLVVLSATGTYLSVHRG